MTPITVLALGVIVYFITVGMFSPMIELIEGIIE